MVPDLVNGSMATCRSQLSFLFLNSLSFPFFSLAFFSSGDVAHSIPNFPSRNANGSIINRRESEANSGGRVIMEHLKWK